MSIIIFPIDLRPSKHDFTGPALARCRVKIFGAQARCRQIVIRHWAGAGAAPYLSRLHTVSKLGRRWPSAAFGTGPALASAGWPVLASAGSALGLRWPSAVFITYPALAQCRQCRVVVIHPAQSRHCRHCASTGRRWRSAGPVKGPAPVVPCCRY